MKANWVDVEKSSNAPATEEFAHAFKIMIGPSFLEAQVDTHCVFMHNLSHCGFTQIVIQIRIRTSKAVKFKATFFTFH